MPDRLIRISRSAREDADGLRFGDELARIGYAGAETRGVRKRDRFEETRIEQEAMLEDDEKVIGAVTGEQRKRWHEVMVAGRNTRSGLTPMLGRSDAAVAAARLILKMRKTAPACGPDGAGTADEPHASPSSRSAISGDMRFAIDLRHPDDAVPSGMDSAIQRVAKDGSEAGPHRIWHSPSAKSGARCIDAVDTAAKRTGLPMRRVVPDAAADQDACQIARKVPAALMSVPCAATGPVISSVMMGRNGPNQSV